MDKIIKGIGVSSGIGVGSAIVITPYDVSPSQKKIDPSEVESEFSFFLNSIKKAKENIEKIIKTQTDEEKISIISAQLEILDDPAMLEGVEDNIKNQIVNAQIAFTMVIDSFLEMFSQIDDEYLRARSLDIKDVYTQVMCIMKGITPIDLSNLLPNTVIVAKDIGASLLISMNTENIEAIVTEDGSKTSHVSIIANNMNIPAIAGAIGVVDKMLAFPKCTVICDSDNNYLSITDDVQKIKNLSKK